MQLILNFKIIKLFFANWPLLNNNAETGSASEENFKFKLNFFQDGIKYINVRLEQANVIHDA